MRDGFSVESKDRSPESRLRTRFDSNLNIARASFKTVAADASPL